MLIRIFGCLLLLAVACAAACDTQSEGGVSRFSTPTLAGVALR